MLSLAGNCDPNTVRIETYTGMAAQRVAVCKAVDWEPGNDHRDVALTDILMRLRYENILRNTYGISGC